MVVQSLFARDIDLASPFGCAKIFEPEEAVMREDPAA
jgi:hypothetical protein